MASRKIVILMLSIAVVALATLIPIAILESLRTPDWQSELRQYIDNSTNTRIQRVWVAEASSVGQFPSDELIAVPAGWTWQGIDRKPPPGRVLCIRLEISQGMGPGGVFITERILLGDHDDGLWHIGWVAYEFDPGMGEAEREAIFDQMGCDRWTETFMSD
jgi:hypothetical protein